MKKLQFCIICLVFLTTLIGCSSNDTKDELPNETGNEENEQQNDKDESNEEETNENSKEEEESKEGADSDLLSIGETGLVESVSGNYEVTIKSFEMHEEIEGEKSLMDLFVVVELAIKNVDDEVISGEDIYAGDIFNDEGTGQGNQYGYEFINEIDEDIEVGETVEGEMIFYNNESEYYDLVWNFGALESNATRLTWRLNADEASN
ncbi:hypothetical protein [Gracilibacillus saliphilus]|uniref:hypothetical protein n=1 Tax=Gracilibacillus saliphilus TaxID=543890 RepID=UPI0013D8A24F|nr:hypothetical protein [Gracilibacillus saliphilus]